ncbi:MAG TPA: helix-turn-helix domain-containing protein [Planktothrix sp.]|jgi:excisionase family DNA binding protein
MQASQSETTEQGQLYSVADAAKYLAISERLVRELIRTTQIGTVKVGRRVLISLRQLESFVQDHQV